MTELQRLMQLFDNLMIAYEQLCDRTLMLETKPVIINECPDGLYIHGWGYEGLWPYSAEFIARVFDRKFREEAVNNPYLLRMQKEGAEDGPERKTVRKSRMRKKGNRRSRSKTSR